MMNIEPWQDDNRIVLRYALYVFVGVLVHGSFVGHIVDEGGGPLIQEGPLMVYR